jgi:amino acid transporter
MHLPDPEGSRAVLIGTAKYKHLKDLDAVANNLEALRATLVDPRLTGLRPENCVEILDEKDVATIGETLQEHADRATDTLIVYYAGHGLLAEDGAELYLALMKSGSKKNRDHWGALELSRIKRVISRSPARRRVLILDCCYAGRAIPETMADPGMLVAQQIDIKGAYTLASCPPNLPSFARKGEHHTVFTGELLRLLNRGIPEGPEYISLRDVYPHLVRRHRDMNVPEPKQNGTDTVHELALARNVAHRPRDSGVAAREARFRRAVGWLGLMSSSASSMLASTWAFAALQATLLAGPAALVSWGLGLLLMLVLALGHAELGANYPVAGASARFPRYAFGRTVGFVSGWMALVGAMAIVPLQADLIMAYLTPIAPWLTTASGASWLTPTGLPAVPPLTPTGHLVAVGLLLLLCGVNVVVVRVLRSVMIVGAIVLIGTIGITALLLLAVQPNFGNFARQAFAPFGWKGIVMAAASWGLIFAYRGFEQAIQFGAESSHPRRDIPIAVVGSLLLAGLVYLGLQVTFIASDLGSSPNLGGLGWVELQYRADLFRFPGPFATMEGNTGLKWPVASIVFATIVGAALAGLVYVASSVRLAWAMAVDGYLPAIFQRQIRGVPLIALAGVCAGSVLLLVVAQSDWQALARTATAATFMAAALASLALVVLRRQYRLRDRPVRLPFTQFVGPAGFAIASEVVLVAGWGATWRLILVLAVGFILVAIIRATPLLERRPEFDLVAIPWFWVYLAGMGLISYLGSFDTSARTSIPLIGLEGPRGVLPFGVDLMVTALFSAAVYAWVARTELRPPRTPQHRGDLVPTEDVPSDEASH